MRITNGTVLDTLLICLKIMIKKLLLFAVSFFALSPLNVCQADIVDDLSAYFKTGNYTDIAKKFASSVELNIDDIDDDVYSKVQGEQILKNFFLKNPPIKSSVFHKINTNPNYQYCVLSLHTKQSVYRVSITLKKVGNLFLITELRIEPFKE